MAAVLSLALMDHAVAHPAASPPAPFSTPPDGSAPPAGTSAPGAMAMTRGWYGLDHADTITTYRPAAPGRYPAVIFVHGGAWGRSQPTSYEFNWAENLAQTEGWLVAVIGYPAKVRNEHVIEPYAMAAAIRAVAHRSDVDDRAIALWGESAGGQLALLAGYRNSTTWRPLVSAVVSISGPTDMRTEYNSVAQVWLHAVTRFEGMTPDAAKKAGSRRYPLTSPAQIVWRGDPATFQAISRFDALVPSNQVRVLTQRLVSAGVPHETEWLTGKDHSSAIESEYPPDSSYTVEQLAAAFVTKVFARHGVSVS